MYPRLPILLLLGAVLAGCASSASYRVPVTREIDYVGGRVLFQEVGYGREAIVFVHGWGCDSRVWRRQLEGLKDEAHLIAVELPGHGGSDRPDIGYSMDAFAGVIASVMDAASVERAVICGHSNGVPVARQFYRLYPERTSGLVLVDGTLRALYETSAREAMLSTLRAEDYLITLEGFLGGMLTDRMEAEDRVAVREMMLSTSQDVLVEDFAAASDPSLQGEDPIDVPLLVVLAGSPFWTEEYEGYVRELAPAVDYHVLSNVGHFLMLESPAEFDELLRQFLRAHSLRTGS